MTGHVYIDLTTLSCWRGPPVGIARCQERYASYALRHVRNVRFTLFDPAIRRHRHIEIETAKQIIAGALKVDTTALPDLNAHRRHFVDKVPRALRPLYWWITKPRRRLISALEEVRLSLRFDARLAGFAERLQTRLMKEKERPRYFDADGKRVGVLSLPAISGAPADFQQDDVTIAMQSDWIHTDIAAISRLKERSNWRHVILCHDLIPIQFPQWYEQSDVDGFRSYYDLALERADRVMFTSNCTAREAKRHAGLLGFELKDSAVVPMGSDIAPSKDAVAAGANLPHRLQHSKFAMFVSTIEPRKNHRLLVEAWRGLVRSGVIGRSGFKLVFVGRPGWKMGSFYDEIATDPLVKDSVLHLNNIDDDTLSRLYRDAAFCLYPPLYEGFGLPIIEALGYGKALIVSNAGPMPEIAGDHAIALDPEDAGEWQRAMGNWIEHPEQCEVWAAKARDSYVPLSWDASGKLFFEKALAPFRAD